MGKELWEKREKSLKKTNIGGCKMKHKKILALLLCSIFMVSAAACGGKTADKSVDKPTDKEKTEATQVSQDNKEEDKKEESENITKSKLWQAAIPNTWIEDKENSQEPSDVYDAKSYLDDNKDSICDIAVDIYQNANSFRSKIIDSGYSLQDFSEGKLENMTKVDDNDAIIIEDSGEVRVLARDAKANADISFVFFQDKYNDDMKSVVESFSLLAADVDESDTPYPWEGERLNYPDKSVKIGKVDLSAHMLPMEEPITTYETFLGGGVQAGDYIYFLNKKELLIYKNTESLKLEKSVDLGSEYKYISVANDGNVYLSSFINGTKVFKGTEETAKLETNNNFIVSPTGTWGVEYFTQMDDIQKVDIGANGELTRTPMTFDKIDGQAYSTLSSMILSKDKIFVCGTIDSNHVVGVYDLKGKLITALKGGNEEILGSITGIIEGKNYYFGSDSNMRSFVLWSKDGAYIGKADDGDLLGTGYPWICTMNKGTDGNIYVILTEERADMSSSELVAFKLDIDI